MENIIELTEKAIASAQWDIDYYTEKLKEAKDRKIVLGNELNALKQSLMTEAKEFEV